VNVDTTLFWRVQNLCRQDSSISDDNGKIGITGTCSGGRYTFLTACRAPGFDAAVEMWGGAVVMAPDQLNEKRPVAPIDYTKDLSCPLLGLFGNDDQAPSPAQVDQHEEELKKHGKDYEFHRYDGAGHGFFYYDRPAYRQQQAMDGWEKIFGKWYCWKCVPKVIRSIEVWGIVIAGIIGAILGIMIRW